MVLIAKHFIEVTVECLFIGAYHVSDNLSVADSCLISSKSCLTSYQIFHVVTNYKPFPENN